VVHLGDGQSRERAKRHAGQHHEKSDKRLCERHQHQQPTKPARDGAARATKERQVEQPRAHGGLPLAGVLRAAQLLLGMEAEPLGIERAALDRALDDVAVELQLALQLLGHGDCSVALRDEFVFHRDSSKIRF
jgi:hypothetical protein